MKRLLLFALISLLITSCTITEYTGDLINPPIVNFNSANFRYITTISGSAAANYHGFWLSSKSKYLDGQFNEAKQNMYKQHQFRPNQIITNMTRDVIKTTNYKGWGRYQINIVLSGDIYEFYSGDPSQFKDSNISDVDPSQKNIQSTPNYTADEKKEIKEFSFDAEIIKEIAKSSDVELVNYNTIDEVEKGDFVKVENLNIQNVFGKVVAWPYSSMIKVKLYTPEGSESFNEIHYTKLLKVERYKTSENQLEEN